MVRIPSILFALLVVATSCWAGTNDCSGAELYSRDSVKYGRWEVRMRAGAKSGTVSSFFLYYNHSHEGGGEPWRELDIEILGKTLRAASAAVSRLTTELGSARRIADASESFGQGGQP